MKKTKFVMLGERNSKGRIAKNEHYSLEEFKNTLFNFPESVPQLDFREFSVFNLIFRRKYVERMLQQQVMNKTQELSKQEMIIIEKRLHELIDADNFGKKK